MFPFRDIDITITMKSHFIYGGIAVGVFMAFLFIIPAHALTGTNISSVASQHWAWNDEIGWIDFNPSGSGNVNVLSAQLTGYASSSAGSISLDCGTAPNGSGGTQNICGTSSYKVNNDDTGSLSGWAWNDEIGWISFYWGNSHANPAASTTALCQSYSGYCGVQIVGGAFTGWAWNDDVGWISFNCSNTGSCSIPYDIVTTWTAQGRTGTLDSQTFDTGVASGAQVNSITWKGSTPLGTSVAFQIAVSNSSSGPWNFVGSDGTSGTTYLSPAFGLHGFSATMHRSSADTSAIASSSRPISGATLTPQVTNIIVNWSP